MGKKTIIIAISAVALLIAGIVLALLKLYTPEKDSIASESPAGWDVLKAVPSDAVAVFVFDGSAKAAKALEDSTHIFQSLIESENTALMRYLGSVSRHPLAVSLHNSGSLVPLVAAKMELPDSSAMELAAKAGLRTRFQSGYLIASRSETFVSASARHLQENISLVGNRHLQELLPKVSGHSVLFTSHAQAAKLLQVYAGTSYKQYSAFVKDLAPWSAFIFSEMSPDHLLIKGVSLPGEAPGSYYKAFSATPQGESNFAEALPYFTSTAISVPISSASDFLEARRRFEDGNGRLAHYNKALKARSGRELNPEDWFKSLLPKEAVRASFRGEDGVMREVALVRSSKEQKLGAEQSNPYRGCLALVLGPSFELQDSVCAGVAGRWILFGDLPAIRAYQDKGFLDYSLKNRLQDASIDIPQGFVAYSSFSDEPAVITQLFSRPAPLQDYVKGAGYAAAFSSLDLSGKNPLFRLSLDKRALKGTKVQVLERDTVVVVPSGLFPVQNFQSGKTNYLYQNSHLSICLNDENGKGVWGIPFKEKLCGRVQSIDYYNNKKIQFLFCAGDKLYLLDRLGHWVAGFPVSLGKDVLLGPDAYDFTGAGGYTIMVLHKDNSLERYNLHGKKADGWKGIKAPETVKDLPELLEVKDRRYWVVRTSIQTLIYPFAGGEPLYKEQGGKMIKPDSKVTPSGKGVNVECYDGRNRDIKLK